MEGLIYRGKFALSKLIGLALKLEGKLTFLLCYTLYLGAISKYKPLGKGGGFHRGFFVLRDSLRSRRLEVAGERENEHARGRHARGEGAPAWRAPENRFNSHSVSADISNWSRGSRGKN